MKFIALKFNRDTSLFPPDEDNIRDGTTEMHEGTSAVINKIATPTSVNTIPTSAIGKPVTFEVSISTEATQKEIIDAMEAVAEERNWAIIWPDHQSLHNAVVGIDGDRTPDWIFVHKEESRIAEAEINREAAVEPVAAPLTIEMPTTQYSGVLFKS